MTINPLEGPRLITLNTIVAQLEAVYKVVQLVTRPILVGKVYFMRQSLYEKCGLFTYQKKKNVDYWVVDRPNQKVDIQ